MATYKGIIVTDTITAFDGLNTESDDPLVIVDTISVKLSKTTYNNYTISFTYKMYKNSNKTGDPLNYKFDGLTTTITGIDCEDHITNKCYQQIGTYLTNNSINYNYVTI
jgi:hypothetical protein